ncbi:hypothetical protein BYT27DRAFT_7253332 [Phlegmacium glaucopus]|nr:hypothetical protein BYT27DRAFT_7253332 [Phlegmacium glaucopus]
MSTEPLGSSFTSSMYMGQESSSKFAVVTSGYRITLTYNICFIDHPLLITADTEANLQIKAGLAALLANSSFLPKGGLVGFGLSHKYLIKLGSKTTKLSESKASVMGFLPMYSSTRFTNHLREQHLHPAKRTH